MNKDHYDWICYTDGSVRKAPSNQFIGGWACVCLNSTTKKVVELAGANLKTTISRMEFQAVISAMRSVADSGRKVLIISDSQYVVKTVNGWAEKWKKNKWTTDGEKAPKNLDLVMEAYELKKEFDVHFMWVRGHDGNVGNERADFLANLASSAAKDKGRFHHRKEYQF